MFLAVEGILRLRQDALNEYVDELLRDGFEAVGACAIWRQFRKGFRDEAGGVRLKPPTPSSSWARSDGGTRVLPYAVHQDERGNAGERCSDDAEDDREEPQWREGIDARGFRMALLVEDGHLLAS